MSHNEENGQNNISGEVHSIKDWADLGEEVWAYLTGRHATIDYSFDNMTVEVPRDIGPDAPRATWKFNGTVRVTTTDDQVQA